MKKKSVIKFFYHIKFNKIWMIWTIRWLFPLIKLKIICLSLNDTLNNLDKSWMLNEKLHVWYHSLFWWDQSKNTLWSILRGQAQNISKPLLSCWLDFIKLCVAESILTISVYVLSQQKNSGVVKKVWIIFPLE